MDPWSEKLRFRVYHRRMYYDVFNAGLLVFLSVMLLPAWRQFVGESGIGLGDFLAAASMPAAVGFLLALRYGTVDLSVWAAMGAGGVVSAAVINVYAAAGPVPMSALLLAAVTAVLAGALIGALNGLILSKFRLPGFVVTALVGLGVIGLLHLLCQGPSLIVPDEAFDPWVTGISKLFLGRIDEKEIPLFGPLVMLRMLLVFCAWTSVLLVLMLADAATREAPRPFARWWVRSASLCASGAVSALAGVCWLIDQGQVPVPTRLVDGVSIPAAVILAGAVLLRGRGRTMLAVIFLPIAMLLVDVWEQMVWPITIQGYSVGLAILGGMVLVAQLAYVWGLDHSRRSRWLAWSTVAISGLGLALLGISSWFRLALQRRLIVSALAICLASVGLLIIAVLRARRHPEEDPFDEYEDEEDEDEEFRDGEAEET